MNRLARSVILPLVLLCVASVGCHKGAPAGPAVSEETRKNAELEATAPHVAPTVLGSAERINMAITNAIDAYRQNNWPQVTAFLQVAKQETAKVLSGVPEKKKTTAVHNAFDEMAAELDRALQAADSRPKGFDTQLTQLQTRAMALKVNAPPAMPVH